MEELVPAAYVEEGSACMDSSLQPLKPNPKSQRAPPSRGHALAVTCCLEKAMAKKSQPDSKGNSSGLLRRAENAARFTPSCRMKGILPNKWQELFAACPLTGLHLPKAGLITATLKIGTDPTGGS